MSLSAHAPRPHGVYYRALGAACFAALLPRKFTNSAFTSSAWVQFTACGPSFMATSLAPLTSLAVCSPEALKGTMRSASP